MKHQSIPTLAGLVLATLGLLALPARADTVTLKNGSVIHGKVLKIEGGAITVSTDFAGDLTIKQDQVTSFETDEPMFLKTQENTAILSKVERKEAGLVLVSPNGNYQTTVADIKSSWPKDAEDPEVVALRRHWNVEINADLTGKSGNSTGFSSAYGVIATLKSTNDALKFYGMGSHAVANGQRSEDAYKGGVEYNAFFSPVMSWFVSTELMQDNVKDISLRVSTLGGIGYNAVRSAHEDLQLRAGLSYRHDSYNTVPPTPSYGAAGCNLGLVHRLDIGTWAVMKNAISYVPAFKDVGNYVIDHDTNLTFPFGGSKTWGLRLGVTNEYTSKPIDHAKRLDSTYYLRLVLNML